MRGHVSGIWQLKSAPVDHVSFRRLRENIAASSHSDLVLASRLEDFGFPITKIREKLDKVRWA